MQLKLFLTLFAVIFFETASARRRCSHPTTPPQFTTIVVIQPEETPKPCIQKCAPICDQLILPPLRVELPRGLGYFSAAAPLVASYYNPAVEVAGVCCGASIPISSPCSSVTIATPICPELGPLVRPVIL